MSLTITVIVTNFNYGRFLRAAIDSALEQTYETVEVIVVDDGSVDDSREIVASYGEAVTAVFKQNGGQASALNAGFEHLTGDVVIFLDADDLLLPETASRVADAFSANERLIKVMYPVEIIDGDGRSTGITKPSEHLPRRNGDVGFSALWFPFDTVWMGTSGNAFASRKLRQLFPIPEEEYRLGADWYLSLITPLLGEVRFLQGTGALHRIHGSNNFERSATSVDLQQMRDSIVYARTTAAHIVAVAERLGVPSRPRDANDVLAVSDIVKRVISKKAGDGHPIGTDTIPGLAVNGMRAASRRTDVSFLMRLLYVLWLLLIVSVPSGVALKLSSFFSYPERRRPLNVLLRRLHR